MPWRPPRERHLGPRLKRGRLEWGARRPASRPLSNTPSPPPAQVRQRMLDLHAPHAPRPARARVAGLLALVPRGLHLLVDTLHILHAVLSKMQAARGTRRYRRPRFDGPAPHTSQQSSCAVARLDMASSAQRESSPRAWRPLPRWRCTETVPASLESERAGPVAHRRNRNGKGLAVHVLLR